MQKRTGAQEDGRWEMEDGKGERAWSLLAVLPELDCGSRAKIAGLAGLARATTRAAATAAPAHIRGSRPKARRIHPRLRAAGKAPKVALIAVARKLLTLLHAALKNPNFVIA